MRNAFVKTLTDLVRQRDDLVLFTGDLGFMVLDDFKAEFPERYFNLGVSENNMLGVAAGMAASGKVVFVYSIAPFVTFRCLEYVRNDVAYHDLPVIIVGVGGGFSYGIMGSTHHAIADIGAMAAIPNLSVVAPGDPIEVAQAVKAAVERRKPLYLRLGKAGEPRLHSAENIPFEIGKGLILRNGEDLTLIATGNMLETAVHVADALKNVLLSARVVSMHTVKPLDETLIQQCATETKAIYTLEEHVYSGGLGNAVGAVIAESGIPCLFKRFAIPDKFAEKAGSQQYQRLQNGLDVEFITESILKHLKK